MNKKHQGELLHKDVKCIEKIVKKKADTYSLDYITTVQAFIEKVKANDFEMIRNIPIKSNFKTSIEPFIKDFMIEQAYFLQEKLKFIEKAVGKILKKEIISQDIFWEVLAFIREESEKNNFERLKRFEERKNSKFTTFLYPVVCNLAITFLRKHNSMKKASEKYVNDIFKEFSSSSVKPEEIVITWEEEEIVKKIRQLIPKLLKQLDVDEQVAFRIAYLEGNENFSAIGRTLNISRYKAEKLAKDAWNKIIAGIRKTIK